MLFFAEGFLKSDAFEQSEAPPFQGKQTRVRFELLVKLNPVFLKCRIKGALRLNFGFSILNDKKGDNKYKCIFYFTYTSIKLINFIKCYVVLNLFKGLIIKLVCFSSFVNN